MRGIGSSHPDPYSGLAGASAALHGPLHGGANEQVLRMLAEIGTKDRVPGYVKRVKGGEIRLMGFGHRVYKHYDPRAQIIKKVAEDVFTVTGTNPLLEIALELERIALQDDYFVSRHLYPNVDFYSGIIYQAMGLPVEMFPVLFGIPRTSGLAGAVGGAAPGCRAEDRPAAADLRRVRCARLRAEGAAGGRVGGGVTGRGTGGRGLPEGGKTRSRAQSTPSQGRGRVTEHPCRSQELASGAPASRPSAPDAFVTDATRLRSARLSLPTAPANMKSGHGPIPIPLGVWHRCRWIGGAGSSRG
jgi:hypothetical protein